MKAKVTSYIPPERNATIGESGKRKWIYPDVVRGKFSRARDIVFGALIFLYIALPWINIAGSPLLKFDLPARRFHIFGALFVATDAFLLALFLLITTIALFLFSAILGRLWCGWGCPQTVYLDGVFRRIETLIEGTPSQRKRLDAGPRNDAYYTKKVTKHSFFILLSAILSVSFTGYFIGGPESFAMLTGNMTHPVALAIAVVVLAFVYFDFAWFREQFCTFLCPYARLQAVMLDKHSLVIGYDYHRGEPRGPIRKNSSELTVLGDCIDCKRCVQVCPTGIDIREGLQLECVNCTACIDACDMVMDKIKRPRGLIRYDSTAGLARESKKFVRARVILYCVVLLILTGFLSAKLSGRQSIEFAVVRPPGTPYLVQEDGKVRNMFQIHLTNVEANPHTISLNVIGPEGIETLIPGSPFTLASGERVKVEAFVMFPGDRIVHSSTEIHFEMLVDGVVADVREAKFLGPVRRDGDEK